MGLKEFYLVLFVIACASAQTYKVCISSSSICQSLERDGSQATCVAVESRIDCALKLARGEADLGYFTDEEVLLLTQQQPNDNRVIATVRDVNKMEPYAFEAVAIVPSTHTGGLEGLKGGRYCHPGLDELVLRWSSRVLRSLEKAAARTDHCSELEVAHKTAEELEVETLSNFFSEACRPGAWSSNATVDNDLKSRFPNLCSLCGPPGSGSCNGYTLDMGVTVAGVNNQNHHIQALECLRINSNTTAVAYVAWNHVREFFLYRNPTAATSFSVMCENGTMQPLTNEILNQAISPCAIVRQPWGALVASTTTSTNLLARLREWWPTGANPGTNTWQSILFGAIVGGANARVVFQDAPVSLSNYTSPIRQIPNIDATASCLPARRWCTLSVAEQTKCSWVRSAAYSLGAQPTISCQQRTNAFECLSDIKGDRADFISAPSNYGYLAREHYHLTPVKLVQNLRTASARVAAFVKETAAQSNITRFENLRGATACFPEFGGLAYVAFVRTAQERGVISPKECDYAQVVAEFFDGACAPGAIDATHTLSKKSFNASTLCSACKPTVATVGNSSDFICTWDYTNRYFGNNGSLACLTDPNTDIAFLNTQNIDTHLRSLGLQANQFRALCRNNTLAATSGVTVDDSCLLAHVVDAEVLTRRGDPLYNALNVLFDTLDAYFGYNAAAALQLINLEIFSPFDGTSDLLFKDSTIGLTEPSLDSTHEPARNYMELFKHLDECSAAPPTTGLGSRSMISILTLAVMAFLTRFVVY